MANLESKDPIERLTSFVNEMNQWEVSVYLSIRSLIEAGAAREAVSVLEGNARASLAKIFNDYGISGIKNRAREVSLHTSDPPAYNSQMEPTDRVERGNGRAIIYTKQLIGVKRRYRYSLKMKNGLWCIFKKETFLHTGNWEGVEL